MKIEVKTALSQYDIVIEKGVLKKAAEHLDLNRRVLIVTDSGVPADYAKALAAQCKAPLIVTVPMGEGSKSLAEFEHLLGVMAESGFTRTDCVAAVGGGVAGDLSGFAAASYMRGIDFYNIPTTVLSQVDSSIGGKTAVNFMGYKNIVGAFYQPKCVLIDREVLSTLPQRQIANGLAEALKMSLTSDEKLFELFEHGDIEKNFDEILFRSLMIKKEVVEQDEKENGLRKVLNFGHTLAHAIESEEEMNGFLHGECVAMGMVPMCSKSVRERLLPVLKKIGLPQETPFDIETVKKAVLHDKKMSGGEITLITCRKIGGFEITKVPVEEYFKILEEGGIQ